MRRGVDSDIIEEFVETEDVTEFENVSCDIVAEKKFRSTPDILKVKKYLLSKGYSYDAVSKSIDNLHSIEDN